MKPGRNDPCPCGSGKIFEKCCQAWYEATISKPSVKKVAPTATECNQLNALFNAGHFAELESQTRLLLEQYPESGFVWNLLGTSLHMQEKDGLPALQNATKLLPNDADVHSNLGNILSDLGRLDEAEASYRRALQINPHNANVYSNLGITLSDLGRLDEAEASYLRALQIKPDSAEAHISLGNTLHKQGRLPEAETSYRQALQIKPYFAEAHTSLGITLRKMGRLDEAEASFRRALEIEPDCAEAHNNLGNTLRKMERLDEAEASYRLALEIEPDYAVAHNNLGNILRDMGRLKEAEASFRRALEIEPDLAEAHNNLGLTLRDFGLLDGASASFRRALEIKPDYDEAYSSMLFCLSYNEGLKTEALFAEHVRFGEQFEAPLRAYWPQHTNSRDHERCLQIGFVSGDFRNHVVAYFVEQVLANLSGNSRLSLHAYANHVIDDSTTQRLRRCFAHWNPIVNLSDAELAKKIRADRIDILIDLSGHTGRNRLLAFAHKPAPVQVSWLGYSATTGMTTIDYLIADPWTLPETEGIYFTEKIWRLPETRLCFTPPEVDVAIAPLPALANGYITFGCFNNLNKMNNAVIMLWARVLASVPNSRLFLKTKQLNEASVRQSVIERFTAHGIGADRMILEGSETREKYLAAYQRVDIALDPFPYPGGGTSVDGLWMGVPMLTLAGKHFLSRQGIGLLMNAGLPEWIAADADDYVARAVSHAGNLQRLATLHNGLRQQVLASPIFDAPRFTRHFEAALRGMWQKWCGQQQGNPF